MGEILNLKNISKSYDGQTVLDHMNFKVETGEILGLLGENGAGKSTLMRIITGIRVADEGEIYYQGEKFEPLNPRHAQDAGISIIHQELNLADNLTVAENIFLGRCPVNRFRQVDYRTLFKKTQDFLEKYGFDLNAKDKVGELTVGKQQMVEIAKAISTNAKVLLMDEPTSALTENETEKLFHLMELLQKQSMGIVFISHKLEEIYRICSKVQVLRDGKDMGEYAIEGISENELIKLMVGREISERFATKTNTPSDEILRVEHLSCGTYLKDINFNVKRGEVFGIAGLMGSGRSALANAIFGISKIDQGAIYIDGKQVSIKSSTDAIKNKIGYVPEDRKKEGLVVGFSVQKNITLSVLNKMKEKLGFINRSKENKITQKAIKNLEVKVQDVNEAVKFLSGGNQQKVVLAKWLETEPDILILDDPTRGIDVGTKSQIYALINELTVQGKAVILISSEMPEVLCMSDRIGVMCEGSMRAIVDARRASQESIMKYAIGG